MGVVAPLEVSYFSSTPPVTVCGTRLRHVSPRGASWPAMRPPPRSFRARSKLLATGTEPNNPTAVRHGVLWGHHSTLCLQVVGRHVSRSSLQVLINQLGRSGCICCLAVCDCLATFRPWPGRAFDAHLGQPCTASWRPCLTPLVSGLAIWGAADHAQDDAAACALNLVLSLEARNRSSYCLFLKGRREAHIDQASCLDPLPSCLIEGLPSCLIEA